MPTVPNDEPTPELSQVRTQGDLPASGESGGRPASQFVVSHNPPSPIETSVEKGGQIVGKAIGGILVAAVGVLAIAALIVLVKLGWSLLEWAWRV